MYNEWGALAIAITNGYATLAELRARMNVPTADTGGDAVLEACIESASRAIDGFTGRRFYQITATARTFTAEFSDCLYVPDLVSVSALVTDTDGDRTYEVTWATTDYDLSPFNASDTYYPYTRIEMTPQGRYGFPVGIAKGVKVTGTWGWPATPDAINEATLIQAARYAKRMAAPFGLDQNSGDAGQALSIPPVDPDVKMLIGPYRLVTIGAV